MRQRDPIVHNNLISLELHTQKWFCLEFHAYLSLPYASIPLTANAEIEDDCCKMLCPCKNSTWDSSTANMLFKHNMITSCLSLFYKSPPFLVTAQLIIYSRSKHTFSDTHEYLNTFLKSRKVV